MTEEEKLAKLNAYLLRERKEDLGRLFRAFEAADIELAKWTYLSNEDDDVTRVTLVDTALRMKLTVKQVVKLLEEKGLMLTEESAILRGLAALSWDEDGVFTFHFPSKTLTKTHDAWIVPREVETEELDEPRTLNVNLEVL